MRPCRRCWDVRNLDASVEWNQSGEENPGEAIPEEGEPKLCGGVQHSPRSSLRL